MNNSYWKYISQVLVSNVNIIMQTARACWEVLRESFDETLQKLSFLAMSRFKVAV